MGKKHIIIGLSILVIHTNQSLSCQLLFTNDSENPVLLVSEDTMQATMIPSSQTLPFGNPSQRACFFLFTQQPSSPHMTRKCKVIQHACSQDHSIHLSTSALDQKKYNADILRIE